MEYNSIFSDEYVLYNYYRLSDLLIFSDNKKILSSIKTAIRIKLINKKSLLRFYKKLIKFAGTNNVLNSYIIFSYCLLKRYLISRIFWFLKFMRIHNISFFIYHFLIFYKAIFSLKMLFEWFPVKNWERASPFKRFLRKVTTDWTEKFEDYVHPMYAWIIVINIVPITLNLIETYFVTTDLKYFATGYNFEDTVEFILESNLLTFK